MSAQNEKALREMHIGDLKCVLKSAAEDARRAVQGLEEAARLNLPTLEAEARLHATSQYLLETVFRLQTLQPATHRPALISSDDVPRDQALQALPAPRHDVGRHQLANVLVRQLK